MAKRVRPQATGSELCTSRFSRRHAQCRPNCSVAESEGSFPESPETGKSALGKTTSVEPVKRPLRGQAFYEGDTLSEARLRPAFSGHATTILISSDYQSDNLNRMPKKARRAAGLELAIDGSEENLHFNVPRLSSTICQLGERHIGG
jgi:hypothetical protein